MAGSEAVEALAALGYSSADALFWRCVCYGCRRMMWEGLLKVMLKNLTEAGLYALVD